MLLVTLMVTKFTKYLNLLVVPSGITPDESKERLKERERMTKPERRESSDKQYHAEYHDTLYHAPLSMGHEVVHKPRDTSPAHPGHPGRHELDVRARMLNRHSSGRAGKNPGDPPGGGRAGNEAYRRVLRHVTQFQHF